MNNDKMTGWEMGKLRNLRDQDIFSSDGEKIGSVRDIYYDESSRQPEWVGVGTGFLGMKERVIPVDVLMEQGDHLAVPYTKDKVKDEPDFDTQNGHMVAIDEGKLYTYFGITGHTTHDPKVLLHDEEYVQ